jgi:hypothetical protein
MLYVGLSLEGDVARVAVVKKEKGRCSLVSSETLPREEVKNLKGEICSGMGGSDLFVRSLSLPLKGKAKILKALPFQLESLLPFPEGKPLVSVQMQEGGVVTVLATTEERYRAHLKELGVEPSRVSCTPAALLRLAAFLAPEEKRVVCLDVRRGEVSCVVVENGQILLSQVMTRDPLCFEKLSLFLKQKGVVLESSAWMGTGEDVGLSSFGGKRIEVEKPQEAIAIGLALDAALGGVQFCQGALLPLAVVARRKKLAVRTVALSLGLFLVTGFLSQLFLKRQETGLRGRLHSEYSLLPPSSSLQEGLQAWESSLKGNPQTFALVPNVPRVSDLLSYLSTHPGLVTAEGELKEGVECERVHYSLTKYPKVGDLSSPYVAKVELEVSMGVAQVAREFHELLLKGDVLVNGKKEVAWQGHNKIYHTSFELNRGVFP